MDPDATVFGQYYVPRRADGAPWELGRGAMGVTYRAFDSKLRVEVVLKVIRPELLLHPRARQLFLREARAAAKVRHPNVAAVLNLHDEEPFYYAMEFVAGEPLSALLKTRGALPADEALDAADQIAAALGAMARERIVHRDLKPANVMVVPDDERRWGRLFKVIDFGLAKGYRGDDGEDPESHLRSRSDWHGGFSGTYAYASPEQCAELPDLDTRSDLYALGVILWQMLAGTLPFVGTPGQLSAMHQTKEPPWEMLAGVPASAVDLVRRLLAKDRAARWASPREFRDALARARAAMGEGPRAAEVEAGPLFPLGRAETVRLGTTLAERWRVGERVAEGDGGPLFRAADDASGEPVALKLIADARAADGPWIEALRKDLDRARAHPHPVWLASSEGLQQSGGTIFWARPWAEGFSLEELLRARGGGLRAAEVWRLLEALPAAADQAAARGLAHAALLLRKLFVSPPSATARAGSDWAGLRTRPVEEWPEFRLRWNPMSITPPPGAAPEVIAVTQASDESAASAGADPVGALATLVRELLGGRRGAFAPLPALGEEANVLLRRARGDGSGGPAAFASAQAFWTALQAAAASGPRPVGDASRGASDASANPPLRLAPSEKWPPPPVPTDVPTFAGEMDAEKPREARSAAWIVALLLLALSAGAAWWFGRGAASAGSQRAAPPAGVAASPSVPVVASSPTPDREAIARRETEARAADAAKEKERVRREQAAAQAAVAARRELEQKEQAAREARARQEEEQRRRTEPTPPPYGMPPPPPPGYPPPPPPGGGPPPRPPRGG